MSPYLAAHNPDDSGFPRVSGDEPRLARALPGKWTFSPRERG